MNKKLLSERSLLRRLTYAILGFLEMQFEAADPIHGQRSDAPMNLMKYLTAAETQNPDYADIGELTYYSELTINRRKRKLKQFTNNIKSIYSSDVRRRLVVLARHNRLGQQIKVAAFLTEIFSALEGDTSLAGREEALQFTAEKRYNKAIRRWADNMAQFDDPIALNNVAEIMELDVESNVEPIFVESFAVAFAKSSSRPMAVPKIRDFYDRSTALALATRKADFGKATDQIAIVRAVLQHMLNRPAAVSSSETRPASN